MAILAALAATVLPVAALTGCSQLEPAGVTQPTTNPSELYLRLTLNYTAVNLTSDTTAPAANTLQLVATPYDGTDAPIADAPAPEFVSLDTSVVTVTSDGLLQGRRATFDPVKVAATLVLGGVRQTDTVMVKVYELTPAPVLDTFSIHVPPEDAVWYGPVTTLADIVALRVGLIPPTTISPRVVDNNGQPIADLTIDYVSLDPSVAMVDRHTGEIFPVAPGYVRIVARTMAFGVAKEDTMTYTVQPRFSRSVRIDQNGFYNELFQIKTYTPTVTIIAGGVVQWMNFTTTPIDVIFDDPTNVTAPSAAFCDFLTAPFPDGNGFSPNPYCGPGNVPAFFGQNGAFRFRRFPTPGTYPYHSTTGFTGTVVVLEPTPPPP